MDDLRRAQQNPNRCLVETPEILALSAILLEVSSMLEQNLDTSTVETLQEVELVLLEQIHAYTSLAVSK